MPRLRAYAVELHGLHVLTVAARSKKAAADLLGTTPYMMMQWEGGMNESDEAIALAEPEQPFRKRLTGDHTWQRIEAVKRNA